LFFTLADVKAFQFRKMASSPMTMPPTTVTSAPVKEEDWPPVLSSVGSISAVQGAVVSTELGGTVGEIRFQNGGEAKKGDVLIRLDVSAEEAQLHTAEADLELARQICSAVAISPHAMSFRRRSRMQLNRNSTG
jgi:Membrane-fusion protein